MPASETTPLVVQIPEFSEEIEAELLSTRLLEADDDSQAEEEILNESLRRISSGSKFEFQPLKLTTTTTRTAQSKTPPSKLWIARIGAGVCVALAAIGVIMWSTYRSESTGIFGPRSQPLGPYELVELQEGMDLFEHYTFYNGPDSAGSNGYNDYVSEVTALQLDIVNVTYEHDKLGTLYDDYMLEQSDGTRKRRRSEGVPEGVKPSEEPFVYISSSHTEKGPRHSVRLEGKRRYHRGLFIIDVRHMPAGCGTWPAFWLTDEDNWPVHGEIDIVEGVNYQSEAKTALHSTKGCNMEGYVPQGVKTGTWDTAVGIPDRKTGIPDMTVREATSCFAYDPHQWLNQGCVAVDARNDTLGQPLNRNGGGVYALEWDPINRHIRTWVFSPHEDVPGNLLAVLRDPGGPNVPDPNQWPLPYGYFAVGDQTGCPASHFQNMRLVINTAFCGSVAGNRFHIDCPAIAKMFKTCDDYLKSRPKEIEDEAYWKIRGVYVYQRSWQKQWAGK